MSGPTERLAAALLADRNREEKPDGRIIACFICGYGFIKKNGLFCSDKCRAWFDAGNPPLYNPANYTLSGWRVIAGSPGIEIGSDYYAGVFRHHPEIICRWRDGRPMKKGSGGFYINCAHCRKEFESKGLKFCSP
jgi:hypothetical protein